MAKIVGPDPLIEQPNAPASSAARFTSAKCGILGARRGLLRRVLYMSALRCIHRKESAFGAYYRRLVQRGLKKGSALMAVMRKMLAVAAHLLMHEDEEYDPSKVCGSAAG